MSSAAVLQPNRAIEVARPKKIENPAVRFRPGELYRLAAVRWGRRLPPTDDGIRFRDRMLDTLVLSGNDGRRRAASFLAFRCSWMTPAACQNAIDEAFKARRYWSPEALGNDLNVTEAEHVRARVRTFRIAGMTDAAMKARQNAKGAARKREARIRERLEPRRSKPARRVDAILSVLPKDGWWTVSAIVSQLKRPNVIVFSDLGKDTDSLRPAVHRAIKLGIKESRLEARFVPGSKMSEVMQIRRGPRA